MLLHGKLRYQVDWKLHFGPSFSHSDYSSFFTFLCKRHSPDTALVRKVSFAQPQGFSSCVSRRARAYCSLAAVLSAALPAFAVAADTPVPRAEPRSPGPPWQPHSLLRPSEGRGVWGRATLPSACGFQGFQSLGFFQKAFTIFTWVLLPHVPGGFTSPRGLPRRAGAGVPSRRRRHLGTGLTPLGDANS